MLGLLVCGDPALTTSSFIHCELLEQLDPVRFTNPH